MALRPGLPEAVTYRLDMREDAPVGDAEHLTPLAFEVIDPRTGRRVTEFETVHEKLFHLLAVSQDLSEFIHDHPALGPDGMFRINLRLPKPGAYRMLCDFYPRGGLPQTIVKTLDGAAPGAEQQEPGLTEDLSPKRGYNLTVSLRTKPVRLLAGENTQLFFDLDQFRGLQPFLGAWAHMLAASWDTEDLIHAHPSVAHGRRTTRFDMIFPRAGYYRMWIQFQREGIVNTVPFTVQAHRRE
jgi:hypothetical protein